MNYREFIINGISSPFQNIFFFFFYLVFFFFTKLPDKMQIGWKNFSQTFPNPICSGGELRYTRCFKNIISFLQSREELLFNPGIKKKNHRIKLI